MTARQKSQLYHAERYDAVCGNCRRGKPAPDGSGVLCPVRGVMRSQSSCKKYEYDPLKRKPPQTPDLPAFEPEQFRL
ncbi:MAG: hypothetical protein LBG83_03820 [Oscillospiraceae bacterium]|jgi:hypothetical protein|nr:hypothetical protein [Oscillospiraceae bacterium]